MTISPLLPIAGAAVGSLAADVAGGIHDSFADVLRRIVSPGDAATEQGELSQDPAAAPAADNQLEVFRLELSEQLRAAGIDLSQPVQLRGDGFGRLVVEGNHPDRARIEQILREDMTLAAMFNELAARYQPSHDEQARQVDDLDPFEFSITLTDSEIEVHAGDPPD